MKLKIQKIAVILIISLWHLNISNLFAQEVIDVKKPRFPQKSNKQIIETKEDEKGVFSFAFENDIFAGTDLGYTNGTVLSYTSPEKTMPKFIQDSSTILSILNNEGKKRITVSVGQNIYTPSDITKSEFINNDFLYAGWLYTSIGVIYDNKSIYDNLTLTLGVVGPLAGAEQTQKYIHKEVSKSPKPQGWDHQLKNEPGIIIAYERKWRELFSKKPLGVDFDIIPHTGINLGNIYTNATIGTTFRIGYNLPTDYGPLIIKPHATGSSFFIPSKKISGYLFSIIEMQAVARNIFLDGNSFKDGPSLNKRNFVKTLRLGTSLTYKDMNFSYSHVFVTKEFKGQENISTFGDITFSYIF